MCSSKDNVLSLGTPNSFYLLNSLILTYLYPRASKWHFIQFRSTSYSCFETTKLLRNYDVLIYLSETLGLYHKQKVWYHQQNYILLYDQLGILNYLNKYWR